MTTLVALLRGVNVVPAKRVPMAELEIRVPVIVKTLPQVAAIVDELPFRVDEDHASRCLVAFARDRAALQGLMRLEARVLPAERFAIGAHAAYLLCPGGIRASEAAKALLGPVGREITTRNWATTRKLHALAERIEDGGA